MDITLRIPKTYITSIDPDTVLTYQVKDAEYKQGLPAIGEYIDYELSGEDYIITFELSNDELVDLIPKDNGDYTYTEIDGVLKQIIAQVDKQTAKKIGDIMGAKDIPLINAFKSYDLPLCDKGVMRLCSGKECKGCEPAYFTDAKGRTYPVTGLDLVEQVKQYMVANRCGYETALLAISKNKEA